MGPMEILAEGIMSLTTGQLPPTRDTVKDCVAHLYSDLLAHYAAPEGASRLGDNLRCLTRALRRKSDPFVSTLAPHERMAVSGFLSMLDSLTERTPENEQEAGSPDAAPDSRRLILPG